MTKKIKLFGTDGIRGQVGRFPLDDDSIVKLGRAVGTWSKGAKIIIGRDTRDSSQHIETLIAAGLAGTASNSNKSHQYDVTSCGVIPTPGLSLVTDHGAFDYGIMITASHNPYTDNGIKIFAGDGEKIPGEMEARIEDIFFSLPDSSLPVAHKPLINDNPTETREIYRHFLSCHVPGPGWPINPASLKIVLDCANGATYEMAPWVFREAGLEPVVTHAAPDGKNINRGCGSTHMETLKETVKTQHADLGIAFDGDGDRVLFVDGSGALLDGDYTLYMISQYFLHTRTHKDFNKIVVGTVMSNLGLQKALEQLGITYTRVRVGDKYVYREMKRSQSILGGEQSGHTILRSFQKTGDGILTALYFLKALSHLGIKPSQVSGQLVLYPQVMQDITIKEKKDLNHWDQLNEMTAAFNEKYGDNSRLLIRYSGTEPKIRLMMESEHQAVIDENIGKFEHLIKSTIGV
ncbi:MAG: phosphoglucosamine mutase [Candidatus Aminicenantes bacterium]|nr:MAG: phosphoglucosamine mutase [Candidatus Aminicenantes bacterium]